MSVYTVGGTQVSRESGRFVFGNRRLFYCEGTCLQERRPWAKRKKRQGRFFFPSSFPFLTKRKACPHLWVQIDRALATAEWAWEAIFVDDGSTDASFAVLGELAKQHPQVRALRFRRNYRKAAALAAGFKQSRGQVIVTMDADLQDDPREIPRLLAELNRDYDLVSGWKAKRRDPLEQDPPLPLVQLDHLAGLRGAPARF